MNGGTDIIIPISDAESAMDLAIRATLRLWSRPVFEDADTGETFFNYRDLVLAERPEILVYRDAAAQGAWKELGADDSLDGTMIHLIARAGELTIGVDDIPNPSILTFAEALRTALRKDLFASMVEPPKEPPKEAA